MNKFIINSLSKLPIYSKFIAGINLNSALKVSNKLKTKNVGSIIDYSVESSKHLNRNIDEIYNQIEKVNSGFIALKFSSLGIDNLENCKNLIDNFYMENLKKDNPNKFLIDAEYNKIQNDIYHLTDYALNNYNTKNNKYFYKTLQMYRNDVWDIFQNDINNYMKNEKYALKLVRGAYISNDKQYILPSKLSTDEQYNKALVLYLNKLKKYNNNEIIIATHNNYSYNLAIDILKNNDIKDNVYFATLLGMADNICFDNNNFNKLKYVPYGPFFETTPYLFRRFIENKEIIKYIII